MQYHEINIAYVKVIQDVENLNIMKQRLPEIYVSR